MHMHTHTTKYQRCTFTETIVEDTAIFTFVNGFLKKRIPRKIAITEVKLNLKTKGFNFSHEKITIKTKETKTNKNNKDRKSRESKQ